MTASPKSSKGNYTKRGPVRVLVTNRPADKVKGEFSVQIGYSFKQGKTAQKIRIGAPTFTLVTKGEGGWLRNVQEDKKVIAYMAKGSELVIEAVSSRGTKTKDVISLAGFTAAKKKIDQVCHTRSLTLRKKPKTKAPAKKKNSKKKSSKSKKKR